MVTLNLPHNNVTMVARLMYSLGLLCSYPLQVMPAFEISEKTACFEKLPQSPTYPRLKSILYRSVLCLFTGLFSILIPRFGLFLNFSGAFSMTFLAFIMPVCIYYIVVTYYRHFCTTRYFLIKLGEHDGYVIPY